MYKIALWNVGENRTTEDLTVSARTLPEVVKVAAGICAGNLNSGDINLRASGGMEYLVYDGVTLVGSLVITNLS